MEGSNHSNIGMDGEQEITVSSTNKIRDRSNSNGANNSSNVNNNNSNNKKKLGELDSLLPQWGVRKRSRCSSRLEQQQPVKHGQNHGHEEDEYSASKSNTGSGGGNGNVNSNSNGDGGSRNAKKASGSTSINGDGGIASRIRNHSNGFSKQRAVSGHLRDSNKDHEMSRSSNRRTHTNVDSFKYTGGDAKRAADNAKYGGGDARNKLSAQSRRQVGGNNNNNNNSNNGDDDDDECHRNHAVDRHASIDDCNGLQSHHEWPRIILVLSRKEKEDDFLLFKGNKPPQRPKKRPKVVEKALLFCTPGYWLSDLSHGRYDVREKKTVRKNHGGLKAMESFESDSE